MEAIATCQTSEISKVMRTPRTVDMEITARCNLRCKYCYYFDNKAVNYVDLPKEEWLQFFDELGRCAVMNVNLAGGEPFIREDLPELLDGIVRNRMRFAILSNGSLISDEIASFIAGTKRCSYVQVSIDGSTPDVHDSCRGKGSFIKAIQGIRTLQRNGVHVAVRVTIHHNNVQDLENIARFLLEDLNLDEFSTNSAGVFGTCHKNVADVLLTTQDRMIAMKTLLRLSSKYEGKISASSGPLDEARRWNRMEAARIQRNPSFRNCGYLTACGCSANKIAVRSDGTIIVCNMLPNICLGRINQDSLQEIWQKSKMLTQFRSRRSLPLANFEYCSKCPYIPYCTGNCPGSAYNLTGEVNHPSPDACLRRFLADGGKIPSLSSIESN